MGEASSLDIKFNDWGIGNLGGTESQWTGAFEWRFLKIFGIAVGSTGFCDGYGTELVGKWFLVSKIMK